MGTPFWGCPFFPPFVFMIIGFDAIGGSVVMCGPVVGPLVEEADEALEGNCIFFLIYFDVSYLYLAPFPTPDPPS
jgi:hypothetical protein